MKEEFSIAQQLDRMELLVRTALDEKEYTKFVNELYDKTRDY